MISVENVSMRFGSKVLFDEVTTTFYSGRRYGLTGPNGAGKSTFMKLLTGDTQPQKGAVVRPKKLGVLRQDQFAFDKFRVIDTVIMGNARLWSALEEREFLYAKPDMTEADGMRLGELEGIVGEEDGYEAESNAAILLQGLDIPDELHHRVMGELQGGQKVRVLLAQALFGHPEALLLDEPTNHLDLDSIHWLRDFLVRYDGTLVVISHDRHFLNAVCTHIADIDYQTIITYTGGYDDMVLAKTQIRARLESQNEQREKKIAQLNDFIARFSAGTRSSQVQSRKKEVERLQTTELARSNIQRPYIKFSMNRPSGRTALEFENLSKAHGAQQIFSNFSGVISRGEKIVLVGRNGAGKTTMLKALLSDVPDQPASPSDLDSGKLRWGHEVSIGYFPQDHNGLIKKGMTAVDWLHQFDPDASRQDIHGLLGQMLFSGEEGLKPTEALSGGETARLLSAGSCCRSRTC
ncbi:MAG TPA: ATP-binding cassette domain-containing protein [Vicinamibacterales bacterium]|nr:ATP-binding cassette domain-containing protein [Vicinamibacterales bacterium]